MDEQLSVELRETTGKRRNRRMRADGKVPAVLYGHGEETICLSVKRDDINAAIRHGARLVHLAGALEESALVRDLQWDTWGIEVLHVDFTRVSADEKITVQLKVELRGEAPGTRQGGVVEQLQRDLQVQCPAGSIPEKLELNINELELGMSIAASQLGLPDGATLLTEPDAVVVQCVEPTVIDEEEAEGMMDTAEPEVIGRKKEDEDSND